MVEPAAGVDRALLAFIVDAYDTEEVEGRKRTVLRLHPRLAPVKVAVLPLVSKEGMPERAREVFDSLRHRIPAEYDEGGSIGKRYRRQDEIGTPWGVTVDGQTMEDDTVTLRDRDSLEQVRVPAAGLADELAARLDRAVDEPEARLTPSTGRCGDRRRLPSRRRPGRARTRAGSVCASPRSRSSRRPRSVWPRSARGHAAPA